MYLLLALIHKYFKVSAGYNVYFLSVLSVGINNIKYYYTVNLPNLESFARPICPKR